MGQNQVIVLGIRRVAWRIKTGLRYELLKLCIPYNQIELLNSRSPEYITP